MFSMIYDDQRRISVLCVFRELVEDAHFPSGLVDGFRGFLELEVDVEVLDPMTTLS